MGVIDRTLVASDGTTRERGKELLIPLDGTGAPGISSHGIKSHGSQGGSKMNIVRAAVVQESPVVFNRKATLEKVHSLVHRAAGEGARLVVLPEAFVSAYPSGLDFGARMGSRTPEGREDFRRYYESAVDVPGPDCEVLGKAAREAGVFLVIGVIERDGGTLYCTVLFFSSDGRLMGKHRKLMPTAMERLVWGFGDGSTMPVFETPLGRIGAVI